MIAVPRADPEARMHRAQALRAKGRCEEAMAELRRALLLRPDFAEAHHQLGNLLKSLGRHAEARSSLREAVRLEPRQAAMWLNLGVACLEIRLLDEAIASFRRALELEPGRPEGHNILGHALLLQGRCTEAAGALETALRLRPGYAAAHDNLGRVRKAQGRSAEAVAHHRAALEELPRAATHSNLLYTLNFLPGACPEEIFAEHKRWAAALRGAGTRACIPAPAGPAQPGRRRTVQRRAAPAHRLRLTGFRQSRGRLLHRAGAGEPRPRRGLRSFAIRTRPCPTR